MFKEIHTLHQKRKKMQFKIHQHCNLKTKKERMLMQNVHIKNTICSYNKFSSFRTLHVSVHKISIAFLAVNITPS